MAGGDIRGERPHASVKEEPGLSTSQMTTQPHPFRSHTGVLERGIGREPLLSSASTQELEAALAARRAKSQSVREHAERDQKKPRLLGENESRLPEFGTQHVRGVDADDGVERFDLTGDDDDLMGGGLVVPAASGLAVPASTLQEHETPSQGKEVRVPYASHDVGAEAPPWVRGLLESIELMHHKQDSAGHNMASMSKDVDTAKARLDNLEEVAHNHNVAHKAAIARMDELERKLQLLKAKTSRAMDLGARGRSPTPTMRGDGDRSPAGSRSPRDVEAEFQIVMGGWRDARKTEAEEEAGRVLATAPGVVKECWAPYIRTTFLKVTLHYPDHATTLPARRTWQMKLIQAVKGLAYKSNAPGSEGAEIWISKRRSVEERQKIRALVVTKEFIEKLKQRPGMNCEAPEIDWRGHLYVGVHQLIGNAEREEPKPEDQFVADSRGNHTQWFVSASKVQKATGLPASELQQTWLELTVA